MFALNINIKNIPGLTGRFFADLVYRRACYGCGRADTYFCSKCYQSPETLPHPICPHCNVRIPGGILSPICKKKIGLDRVFVCAFYKNGAVNKLIKDLKYRPAHSIAKPLANFAWWWLEKERYSKLVEDNVDIIIPVPSHIKKEKRRGFNHANKIAEQLAVLSGITVAHKILIKEKNTESQVKTSSREDRVKNVKDSFAVNKLLQDELKDKNVLLLDDVITTGSTISACAKTLREKGAKEVWALVIAKD
ncbi:MAG: ComF family protein [Candidatus Spechtbacterales bacterium]